MTSKEETNQNITEHVENEGIDIREKEKEKKENNENKNIEENQETNEEETEKVVIANPDEVFKKNDAGWYEKSEKYWAKQEKNSSGMLGGYPQVSEKDISQSCGLIEKYQKKRKLGNERAADCGCGIGRVSEGCLAKYFKHIDLIDPVAEFVDEAAKKLEGKATTAKIKIGIQDWQPDAKYDIIWCQWSVMYLKDDDAVKFLRRCKRSLNEKGIIVIKDNIATSDKRAKKNEAQFFKEDNGICRTYAHFMELFALAELDMIECTKQKDYPEDLLPLYFFVLD